MEARKSPMEVKTIPIDLRRSSKSPIRQIKTARNPARQCLTQRTTSKLKPQKTNYLEQKLDLEISKKLQEKLKLKSLNNDLISAEIVPNKIDLTNTKNLQNYIISKSK